DCIELRVLQRVPANQHGHADEQKNKEFVLRADIDNSVNHCYWASASTSGRLRKTPPFWATNVSAAFRSLNANVPGEQRSNASGSMCLDSSILDMSCSQAITRLSSTNQAPSGLTIFPVGESVTAISRSAFFCCRASVTAQCVQQTLRRFPPTSATTCAFGLI